MVAEGMYKVSVKGEGVNIERTISAEGGNRIINILLGGKTEERMDHVGVVAAGGEARRLSSGSPLRADAFMMDKRPATDIEKVTCLAYLLERGGVREFKTREITDMNREAQQPRLSNASFAVRNAASSGFLGQVGGGRKQITTLGRTLVEALPDRGSVKAVLEDNKKYKRRRGKRAKPLGKKKG